MYIYKYVKHKNLAGDAQCTFGSIEHKSFVNISSWWQDKNVPFSRGFYCVLS